MKTPIIRVSLAFGNEMPDDTLITFARSVHALLYVAAGFTNIPITAAVLEGGVDAFATTKAAQASGGKAATAEKNNKRADLVKQLKELAFYVQVTSDNNLAMLLSTGFQAVSTNRARVPLAKPAVLRVVTGMSGEGLVTLTADKASRGSEVRVAEVDASGAPGPYRPVVSSTSSRNIAIPDLVPGQLYAYQGRNFGGATTFSDWSDVLVQRAA
jgi:hypothetical protein